MAFCGTTTHIVRPCIDGSDDVAVFVLIVLTIRFQYRYFFSNNRLVIKRTRWVIDRKVHLQLVTVQPTQKLDKYQTSDTICQMCVVTARAKYGPQRS